MGKSIGPKTRIARRFGEAIYGADKSLDKRNVPPGQHGLARKRKKGGNVRTKCLRSKHQVNAVFSH